jgi:hypothetical protein
MFRSLIVLVLLFSASISLAQSDEILCPRQKQPACQDILPTEAKRCERDFCNVAASSSGGRVSCLWTCAAHFEGLSIHGTPVDSLFDALKKSQKQ